MSEVIHRYIGRDQPIPKSKDSKESAARKKEREKWDTQFRKERAEHECVRRIEREANLHRMRGELISRDVAQKQASFLFVTFRERLLARARKLPRKLLGKSLHEMKLILHEDACEYLNELEALPDVITCEQFEE
jgi:hypothetical protein